MATRARDVGKRERFDRRRVVLFTRSMDGALVAKAASMSRRFTRTSVNDVVRAAVDAYFQRRGKA